MPATGTISRRVSCFPSSILGMPLPPPFCRLPGDKTAKHRDSDPHAFHPDEQALKSQRAA
jgi:hypothetical protein